ncbi:MAG: NAD(P)/FAD-dependent oxidoreductase [Clostridia bacterium]|nr:NAD(P)/FAD-dependent oxidoreductase [Clostridia bacterium]
MYDVAVIGAGVVGAMIARELAAYKLNICILEKEHDVAMGATKANSAIVHAGFDAKEGSLKAKLNVKGSKMMENVTHELGVKYRRNGSLVVGFNEEDRVTLETLLERGKTNGVEGLEIIERDRLTVLEPNIADGVKCALYAPTGAIVCPYELTVAAIGNAMDNGAKLKCSFPVTTITAHEDFYEISSGNDTVKARFIVNAAGVYSDAVARMIGDDTFTVHPRRGEYLVLDKECGNTVSHTIFMTPSKMGKGILVSPTVDNNLLLGPTAVDTVDKDDKSTTPEFFTSIFDIAAKTVKNIPRNKTITSFCGLRAVGDTGDFIITSPREHFINAAGIESPGLSASPAIAEYVRELLGSDGLKLEKKEDHVRTRRPMHAFREANIDEKNRMIKENPAYGRIVCRCEGVTEGEILDAIRTNPRATDLDGVKRRTRAQMGRCQGGFCSPYIIELLSRELDIPYENVTKFGGESNVALGKTKEDK